MSQPPWQQVNHEKLYSGRGQSYAIGNRCTQGPIVVRVRVSKGSVRARVNSGLSLGLVRVSLRLGFVSVCSEVGPEHGYISHWEHRSVRSSVRTHFSLKKRIFDSSRFLAEGT